jgi:DNA-binding PadR family transcriptional regulator
LVNDICVGIDTSVIVQQRKPPVLRLLDETPIRPKSVPIASTDIYNAIQNKGPMSTTQLMDFFGASTKKDKNKIYQTIHGLKKEGYVDRDANQCYSITTKSRNLGKRRRRMPAAVKRIEKPVTQDNILEILASSDAPKLTFAICNELNLRTNSKQRPKVTRLLRNEMHSNNLITINEKTGGKSTYELTPLGRERYDDIKVISTVLEKRG